MNFANKTAEMSLLRQHLDIAGLSSERLPPAATARERAWLETIELKPLSLRAPASRPRELGWWTKGPQATMRLFALAALITLIVLAQRNPFSNSADDDFTVKGAVHVAVYAEHGGAVALWKVGGSLSDGDRLRVEITAPAAGHGYAAILRHDGLLITPASDALHDELRAEHAGKLAFPSSFQLTSPNEGEILVVLWARSPNPAMTEARLAAAFQAAGTSAAERGAVGEIDYIRFKLR